MRQDTSSLAFLADVAQAILDRPGIKRKEIARTVGTSLEDLEPALVRLLSDGSIKEKGKRRPRR